MPKKKTAKKAEAALPEAALPENDNLHAAEAAFNALRPRLDAISLTGIEAPRLDLQAAAIEAMRVSGVLAAPATRAGIVAMAAVKVVDLALIDGLEEVAWATWFARHKLLATGATHSEASLPASLTDRAREIRGRMLKTLEYHLEGDAEATAQLAYLRSGNGYMDLAADLSSVADLYKRHHAAIAGDSKNFRATDEADARATSEQMLRLLGATTTPEQTQWKGYQARAAKLLFQHHDEAIRVGRFLSFHEEPERRFPTLFAATRAPAAARADKKPAEGSSALAGDAVTG